MVNNFIKKIPKFVANFFNFSSINIDLGTSMTRLAITDKGIIAREPTISAYNQQTKDYLFFGQKAKAIMGKTPNFIKIIKPLSHGVINDFDSTLVLLENLIQERLLPHYKRRSFLKSFFTVLTAITNNATEIERKALEELLAKLGFGQVLIFDKSIAHAALIKDDLLSHKPILIVDLGGGLIDVSLVSGGGIIVYRTLKNAGEFFFQQISHYLYLKYGVIIGEHTAEQLLTYLVNFVDEEKNQVVRGKSLETGLPKSVRVKTSDIRESLTSIFNNIFDIIREVIEFSPPEAVDEVYKNGIFLVGGLANIKGIDNFFSKNLKIQTIVLDKPEDALINGLIKLSKQPKILRNFIVNK